jgi:hypothetical protein
MQPVFPHYHISITPKAAPARAFQALTTEVDRWWGPVDRPLRGQGDRYSIIFDRTKWTFVAIEFESGRRLKLQCVAAHHVHPGMPDSIREEWKDTCLSWTIEPTDGGCTVHFEHEGLTPRLQCFGICEAGWNHFLGSSLLSFLDHGRGQPA